MTQVPPTLSAPAALRNREPILEVVRELLSDTSDARANGELRVLEVASGTGEHVTWFAQALPEAVFVPSDPDPRHRASVAAWTREAHLANVVPPLELDTRAPGWERHPAIPHPLDLVVCINMIHIAPWEAALGLFRGAANLLRTDGWLYLYGPYREGGRHTAPSNEAFDRSLRQRDPSWGVRDLEHVQAAAADVGLEFARTVRMPANNLSVILRKSHSSA